MGIAVKTESRVPTPWESLEGSLHAGPQAMSGKDGAGVPADSATLIRLFEPGSLAALSGQSATSGQDGYTPWGSASSSTMDARMAPVPLPEDETPWLPPEPEPVPEPEPISMPGPIVEAPEPEQEYRVNPIYAEPVNTQPVAEPSPFSLVARKQVTSADGTDALIFAAMFLFIEVQRGEVAKMMEAVQYNNDMARKIEELKAAANAAADRARAKTGANPTETLPQNVVDYLWYADAVVGGENFRSKFASIEEARAKAWSPTELTQITTALDIERTKFTDMNSQMMQKLQMQLGLLNVYQQMLTSLIDSWKRVKETIASKL